MADEYDEQHDSETQVGKKRRFEDHDDDVGSKDGRKASYGKEPLLKVLVPNDAAGAIIGKGGSNLSDLKNRYGATIRISHSRDTYPGTNERIVIITGEVDQIIDIHSYVIEKVAEARDAKGSRDERRGGQVWVILPNNSAGIIIGKGGETIKTMKDESQANILIKGRDETEVRGERLLIIKGSPEQLNEAARLVIGKIATDPDNMANTSLRYSNRGRDDSNSGRDRDNEDNRNDNLRGGGGGGPLGPLGGGAPNLNNLAEVAQQLVGLAQGQQQQNNTQNVMEGIKTDVRIQMEIPELLVGAIMGVQGTSLAEFKQFSGASIEFSRDMIGSTHRLLTINGSLNESQVAYHLVTQKVTQVKNELLAAGLQQQQRR